MQSCVQLTYYYPLTCAYFSTLSDSPGTSLGALSVTVVSPSPTKRLSGLMSALNSVETMQKSVMNAFALKYSESNICVGRATEVIVLRPM